MTVCPKCHYVRQSRDNGHHEGICPSCGIAYAKWRAHKQIHDREVSVNEEDEQQNQSDSSLWSRFMELPERVDELTFWGRAVTWSGLLLWELYFARHGVDWEIIGASFLHNINLAFHEFGHVFFYPFGNFMMILGGSLFQVLTPLALLFAFAFYQRDNFGASVMLWWCGQNFVDISPYIRDAIYRSLPLVGGGGEESHDWGNLLTMLNAVDSAPRLGNISFGIGCCLMFTGLFWGACILRRQYALMKAHGI